MKLKKYIIFSLGILTVFSLTSCSFLEDIFSFEETENIDTTPTTTTDSETPKDTTESSIDIPTETTKEDITEESTTSTDSDDEFIMYGYSDLLKYEKKDKYISFYKDVYNSLNTFYSSNTDLETTHIVFSDSTSGDYYIIDNNVNFSKYNLSYNEAAAIYKTVSLDYPEFYFLDNLLLNGSKGTSQYLQLICDEDYHLASVRQDFNQKITTYENLIKEEIKDCKNDIEKVKKIHDYIINNSSYAFKEDGETPDDSTYSHNIIGIMTKGKGVCESYAKSFQYLLGKNNIECAFGSGYGVDGSHSESHAWNYVKLNNLWYGFDLTWDDPIYYENHVLTPKLSYEYFGKVDSDFTNSHVLLSNVGNMDYGIQYLYNIPTLATSNLVY